MASPKSLQLKLTTETEHLLYKTLTDERNERNKLRNLVDDLKGQIEQLQSQLEHIREQSNVPSNKLDNEEPLKSVQYETDEEELAKETGWLRQKTRKKRKLNLSLSPPSQEVDTTSVEAKKTPKVKKPIQPPPIVVENIKNYQKIYDFLLNSELPKDSFIAKMMNGDTVKINALNEDSYRVITKLLQENNCHWHSYENKQDRPIRVMAKNLHASCLPNRIVEDLTSKGYKIENAVNKLSWRTKEPLNMFMLSFQKDEEITKIYSIKSILGCKVDIQPLRTTKLIPQCKRCQAYGHTQKYCSKEPRCVKCTGKHLTIDCNKPLEVKPKCVHCGEPHPASYRGCMVAKELQNIRNKRNKKTVTSDIVQASAINGKKPNVNKLVTKNVSYAQATKPSESSSLTQKLSSVVPQKQTKQVSFNMDEKIDAILNLLTTFDARLKKLELSNKPAITHKN